MATIVPISALPQGVVSTNTALTAVDISTVGENATVTTLGGTAVGDGRGGTYYFVAGSSRTADNYNVIATSNTGRWIRVDGFSGVGPLTSSFTGRLETFALLSGFAPVTYTLPAISTIGLGRKVTVKSATTGTFNVRCGNSTDLIVTDSAASPVAPVAVVTSSLTGGQAFTFQAGLSNRWFVVNKVHGAI